MNEPKLLFQSSPEVTVEGT